MPDWVLRLTATGEQQGQDDEQQQGQDDEEQQEAREMSENVIIYFIFTERPTHKQSHGLST